MTARKRRAARGSAAVAAPPQPPPASPLGRRGTLVVALLAAVHVAVFFTVCVIKYRYYLYRDFDLAIFTQAVAQLPRGSLYSSIRGMDWPGDHSSLVLLAIAPLYALVRHPLTLVFAQSVAVALGAFPLAALARREGLRETTAIVVAALYLLHPAVGYGELYEFHPELLAMGALIATLYFLQTARLGPTLAWAAAAASCKEDVALVVLALAGYALIVRRERRLAFAWPLAAIAGASLALSFGVLKPMFNQGESAYGRMYEAWGSTPAAMLGSMLSRPIDVVSAFFFTPGDPGDSLVKQLDHVHLLLPVMGLSLLSPLTLLTALPIGIEHFLSSRYQQHTIVFQYAALLVPSVAVAAVIGLRRLAGWGVRAPALPAGREHALTGAALACSIASNLMFGPLLGHGVLMRVSAPEAIRPSGYDRALAPWRDRLVRMVPRQGGVVAGFEMLPRFADRAEVHSLHHVLLGRYTFSTRPFVAPTGVTAVIADLSDENLTPYVQPGSGERFASLLETNGLAPGAQSGDLVLFASATGPHVKLVEPDSAAATATAEVDLDGVLVYLGARPLHQEARPGERVAFETHWRRTGPIDRTYLMNLALLDAGGVARAGRARVLGYGAWTPDLWPMEEPLHERAEILLPADLSPGTYTLAFDVGWRAGSRRGRAESGLVEGARDPRMALGTIVVGVSGPAAR